MLEAKLVLYKVYIKQQHFYHAKCTQFPFVICIKHTFEIMKNFRHYEIFHHELFYSFEKINWGN